MNGSGNSAGEEADVGLLFTFTAPDIQCTSEVYSGHFKRISSIDSTFQRSGLECDVFLMVSNTVVGLPSGWNTHRFDVVISELVILQGLCDGA